MTYAPPVDLNVRLRRIEQNDRLTLVDDSSIGTAQRIASVDFGLIKPKLPREMIKRARMAEESYNAIAGSLASHIVSPLDCLLSLQQLSHRHEALDGQSIQ